MGAIADMSAVWLFILCILQTDLLGPLSPGHDRWQLEHCPHRHGPVGECPISATKEVLAEFLALEEDSPKRREMEARYGRVALKKLMDEYEREKDFMDWLERCTGIPCPGCELRVEKHSGCNHVRGEHSRLPRCS